MRRVPPSEPFLAVLFLRGLYCEGRAIRQQAHLFGRIFQEQPHDREGNYQDKQAHDRVGGTPAKQDDESLGESGHQDCPRADSKQGKSQGQASAPVEPARDDVLEMLEARPAQYAVVARMTTSLKRALGGLGYERLNPRWEIAEFEHRASDSPQARLAAHKLCRYWDGSGRRRPGLRAGSGSEPEDRGQLRAKTSTQRNRAAECPRPCTQHPSRRRRASRRCGSARWSDRSMKKTRSVRDHPMWPSGGESMRRLTSQLL